MTAEQFLADLEAKADAALGVQDNTNNISRTVRGMIFSTAANPAAVKRLVAMVRASAFNAAWGGEIPSPLPGHRHMTEEEFCENYNCPWCGGSGHVDDCDEADKAALKDALAAPRERERVLVEALCAAADYIGDESAGSIDFHDKYRAALARVKEDA